MRKVTASAVILTALTGCSQSNIPSTQWSFEVPTEDNASDSAEATLVSGATLDTGLSEDAQSFVSQAAIGRMMGPAFEQPSAEVPLGARVSTVGRPGSKEVSTLAAEAYGITNGLSAQPSTRPDPVAQVRAYLRSTGSPSALTNRTPYTSEVYLSSLPTPNQYYEPSTSEIASAPAVSTSDLGLTGTLPAPFTATEPTVEGNISNSRGGSALEVSSLQAGIFQTDIFPSSTFSEDVAAATPLDSAGLSATGFDTPSFDTPDFNASGFNEPDFNAPTSNEVATAVPFTEQDSFRDDLPQGELPQLAASLPSEGDSALAVSEAPSSIGTAILQDLQAQRAELPTERPVDLSAQVPAQTDLPNLNAGDSSFEMSQFEAAQLDAPQADAVQTIQPAFSDFTAAPTTSSFYEPLSSSRPAGNSYAYVPENDIQASPSLTSLTETMPARDISPLVDSFRSLNHVLPASDAGFNDTSTSESNLEAFGDLDEQPSSYAPDEMLESSTGFSGSEAFETPALALNSGTEVNEAHSPLLQGFEDINAGSEVESTIYVPIAEDSALSSSILLQNAEDTLGKEVSTTDFLSELTAKDTFSSVLTSSAFTGDSPLITLTSLPSQSEDNVSDKQATLKVAHRNATVALAAKQTSKRRQRLTWM